MSANDELPVVVWSGEFVILGVPMKCHTLNDGQRIIEADSVAQLFAVMNGESEATIDIDGTKDAEAFTRWRAGL